MRLIPRSEWGNRYGVGWRIRALPATSAWLHHSVTNAPGPNATLAEDIAHMRLLDQIGYDRFKYADTGWSRPAGAGISYTAVVMPSGRAFEGHDINRASSHTSGYNTPGIGICFAGNYDVQEPTDPALQTGAWLLAEFKRRGQLRTARFDGGHRDTGFSTACPGGNLHRRLGYINSLAAQYDTGKGPVTPPANKPDPNKGFDMEHLERVESLLDVLGYEGADVWARVRAYQQDMNLEADGLPGPATTAHLEDTMSKIDDLLAKVDRIPNAVWTHRIGKENAQARSWLRGGNLKAGRAQAASQEAAATIAGQDAAIKVLSEAIATQQNLNADQLRDAVHSAMSTALAGLKADVTLTIEEA